MARVCVVSRVISNFMGSTSSRLKDTMKLALLVLLCNCLCCFSVIVAIITDDMRRQIDRMNNASQPSRPKSQTGSGFDRMNSSGQMEPSQIAHISELGPFSYCTSQYFTSLRFSLFLLLHFYFSPSFSSPFDISDENKSFSFLSFFFDPITL